MTITYKRDDSHNRYLVYFGDDRIGFVKKLSVGNGNWASNWNAVDIFMDKDRDFPSRAKAGDWLKREYERAIRDGRV